MKELKLTKGEWQVSDESKSKTIITDGFALIASTMGDDGSGYYASEQEAIDNAQAIVTAINNTYKKGINPEAIPDWKDALIKARKDLSIWLEYAESLGGRQLDTSEAISAIDKALEKAGVHMEESA